MKNSVLVAIHPGTLRGPRWRGYRDKQLYGDYKNYLYELKNTTWEQDSFVMQDVPIKTPIRSFQIHNFLFQRKIPFKVPKKTEVIKDDYHSRTFWGGEKLVPLLKEKGITNVDIGGESLWYFTPKRTIWPGCLIYYYRRLSNDFSVRIRRELCYPQKEPNNDGGKWLYESLKTYAPNKEVEITMSFPSVIM